MSHVVPIYERLRELVFDKLPESFNVHLIDLTDPYHIGAELHDRLKRLGPQNGLNAIIVSPLEPEEDIDGDAGQWTKTVVLPLLIYFVYKRGDTTLAEASDRWADPLQEILDAEEVRRLDNFELRDRRLNKKVGHVINFIVGEPNFDPPDNDDLYTMGLACFTIGVQVRFIKSRDVGTTPRSS